VRFEVLMVVTEDYFLSLFYPVDGGTGSFETLIA
jgi:hypothetical protein